MAAYSNLVVDQGADFETLIEVSYPDDSVSTLTEYTVEAQIRRTYQSLTKWDFICEIYNADEGLILISLPATESELMRPGRYLYDVKIISPEGKIHRVVEGQLELTASITRG